MHISVRAIALLASGLLVAATHSQTSPTFGPAMPPGLPQADIPLEDYLALLEQIAPAARHGAQAYLDAFRRRCGRALTAEELRRAVADRDGDPILMQMIRASALDDLSTLTRLAGQVPCRPSAQRSGATP
ncbi:hypothetical protein [Pseudoxanthomonas mexicana]|uniref:hypothetical protein n=1 Tax=Pseudoxanthomonas mexicana TaxID=128785 RepID=UPI0028B0216C|nr:hypothetical protein [Pseudoxanthomonas mexicana]